MPTNRNRYDVAIIGTGIGGSILGTILARQGLKAVLFEAACHPKFAIGESMILESSEALRLMAQQYEVPELAYFSSENFFAQVGTSHGVKRHFGFMHHQKHNSHNAQDVLQAVIPREPYGHELHLYRQDSDYFFMSLAVKYGATVFQKTGIEDVAIHDDCVTVTTNKGEQYEADYIVDAGGFRSLLAQKFNLRDFDMQTHSRAIFTHMIGVPSVHQTGSSQKEQGVLHSMFEGTLHHIFHGGWMWVIPFNNHARSSNPLCSVGLMLDPRIHPKRDDLSPEEEFHEFVKKYPSIEAHLASAKPVRDWVSTGRIQYSSKQIVGDRFCLMGHAAGFVDPLFSRGLYSTFASISVLAQKLIDAHRDQDYDTERFRPVEKLTLDFIKTNDRMVANAYKSFSNQKLWTLYAINWILGAYLELLKLGEGRMVFDKSQNPSDLHVFENYNLTMLGGGFEEYYQLHDHVNLLIESTDPQDLDQLEHTIQSLQQLYESTQWIPISIKNLMYGKKYLDPRLHNFLYVLSQRGTPQMQPYWKHFFGTISVAGLMAQICKDKLAYSAWNLKRLKKKTFRQPFVVASDNLNRRDITNQTMRLSLLE